MILAGQIAVFLLAIIGVIWCWKNPRYFLPFVLIALPLDVSRTWFPQLAILDQLGAFVGVINFARIFSLAFIARFFFSLAKHFWGRGNWNRLEENTLEFYKQPIFLVLIAYIVLGLISTLWSVNPMKSIAESVRLLILLSLGLATYNTLKSRSNVWVIPDTLSIMATLLGLLGIYQMAFKKFLWMGDIYLAAGRINGTFVDANIYARFLIIGVLATLIGMIARHDLRSALLGAFALIIQLSALMGTGSRTGWLTMVLVLVLFMILVPRRQVIFVLIGLFCVGLLGIALHPEFLSRIADLRKGLAIAATERQYLIKAGWDMFIHHPLLGVGLGGFQTMMFTSYPDLIRNEISLSHTSLITTGAELGIIGLFELSMILLFVYLELFWNWRMKKITLGFSGFRDSWLIAVFGVLSITVIFLSAQGEGRFFEDPALWIFAGLLAALRKGEGA